MFQLEWLSIYGKEYWQATDPVDKGKKIAGNIPMLRVSTP